jgi:hypothetical protein
MGDRHLRYSGGGGESSHPRDYGREDATRRREEPRGETREERDARRARRAEPRGETREERDARRARRTDTRGETREERDARRDQERRDQEQRNRAFYDDRIDPEGSGQRARVDDMVSYVGETRYGHEGYIRDERTHAGGYISEDRYGSQVHVQDGRSEFHAESGPAGRAAGFTDGQDSYYASHRNDGGAQFGVITPYGTVVYDTEHGPQVFPPDERRR